MLSLVAAAAAAVVAEAASPADDALSRKQRNGVAASTEAVERERERE